MVYASANLIHRLLPTLLVGAETLWGRATRVDGVTATNARLQLSLRYLVAVESSCASVRTARRS